jgi:Ser-tRNA(Ala) deacylase AlaX
MTSKIFWSEPYRTALETTVVHSANGEVALAQTIFFAECGGQESDRGTIGGHEVLAARRFGQEIFYALPAGHELRIDDWVTVRIDWPRRYRLMRLHFAAEVLLELMYRNFPGIAKVGAHIAEEKARIDFEWDSNLAAHLPGLLEGVRGIVHPSRPIVSAFANESTGERYWEVEGFARTPCGGTHLKETGEVGDLELRRRKPGKGKERIEILLKDKG